MEWNQKPHRYTVDVPPPLVPIIEARRLHVPYPSVSKYFFWMAIYDAFLRKPHRFTPWLMRQPEEIQREFFETLISDPNTPTPGSWMETRIREEAIRLIESGAVDDIVIRRAKLLREFLAI